MKITISDSADGARLIVDGEGLPEGLDASIKVVLMAASALLINYFREGAPRAAVAVIQLTENYIAKAQRAGTLFPKSEAEILAALWPEKKKEVVHED